MIIWECSANTLAAQVNLKHLELSRIFPNIRFGCKLFNQRLKCSMLDTDSMSNSVLNGKNMKDWLELDDL